MKHSSVQCLQLLTADGRCDGQLVGKDLCGREFAYTVGVYACQATLIVRYPVLFLPLRCVVMSASCRLCCRCFGPVQCLQVGNITAQVTSHVTDDLHGYGHHMAMVTVRRNSCICPHKCNASSESRRVDMCHSVLRGPSFCGSPVV